MGYLDVNETSERRLMGNEGKHMYKVQREENDE